MQRRTTHAPLPFTHPSPARPQIAKLVLSGMRERGRGVIVNIGSGVATLLPSSPLLSVYAGSKAYVDCLSRSLDVELARFGVRVQNQAPLFVATKMSKIRRASLAAPSPQQWARAAVRQIGYETTSSPFWYHALQVCVVGWVGGRRQGLRWRTRSAPPSLRCTGRARTRMRPAPCRRTQAALVRSLPSWMVTQNILSMHLRFRAGYYRRLARTEREAAAAAVGEGSPTKPELRKRK